MFEIRGGRENYQIIITDAIVHPMQGGILFWLRGSLRDWPGISPEIAFITTRIMTENLYKVYIF